MVRRRWPPTATALGALIEEAIVDAYGSDEQRVRALARKALAFGVHILSPCEFGRRFG